MTAAPKLLWSLAAKSVVMLLAFGGIRVLWKPVLAVIKTPPQSLDRPQFLTCAGMGILLLLASGVLFWMAWWLWFRWNALTVRWATILLVVSVCVWLSELLAHVFGSPANEIVFSLGLIAGLIAGPIAYRRIARTVIRVAQLSDLLDEYGQSQGHAVRVKTFAMAMGWGLFSATVAVGHGPASHPDDGLLDILRTLGPMILGWTTYKAIMWRMKPPTRKPLPPGGFEVLPMPPVSTVARQVV